MRRVAPLVLLALAQVAAALSLAQPAHAATVLCSTGYDRLSPHSSSATYEEGIGYGQCAYGPVARIDVRLTYVYCSTTTSCNTTGSNFGGTAFHDSIAYASGGIYNLRGYYKVIMRASFTLYAGQTFSWKAGNNMVKGDCGPSGTDYWSCAYESAVFQRGA